MTESVEVRLVDDALLKIAGGWCRGYYSRTIGGRRCYCLKGALDFSDVEGAHYVNREAVDTAVLASIERRVGRGMTMTGFNDDVAKDKRQVIAVLKDARSALSASSVGGKG